MPRIDLALLLIPVFAGAVVSSDPVDLFKRHRYEEAASIWEKDVRGASLDEKGVRALKGLSMAYHQLGSLYARLHPFSLALQAEYYRGVLSEGGSALALYYQGQVQCQNGRWDSAAISFEKARKTGGAKVPAEDDVFLAYALGRRGNNSNPNVTLKSSSGRWQALDLSGADPSAIPADLKTQSPRERRCRLSILSRSSTPMVTETYQVLQSVLRDGQNPEMSQNPGRNTQLDFYDPFLLETLSRACFALSQWWQMRLLEEEKRFPVPSGKFSTPRSVAETCLLRGRYPEALQYLGSKDSDAETRLLRAKILGKLGRLAEARELIEGVSREAKTPVILREVAESYYFLTIDLQKGLRLATQALKDKDGANYYRISAALLLATGQNDAALQEYARGYKIEFRNRIDQNDPEYMSDYSFAIFLSNKMRYEEIVETLYHLQKEIPACRQMHYAMQGISAASARSYEAQRIFRKGG